MPELEEWRKVRIECSHRAMEGSPASMSQASCLQSWRTVQEKGLAGRPSLAECLGCEEGEARDKEFRELFGAEASPFANAGTEHPDPPVEPPRRRTTMNCPNYKGVKVGDGVCMFRQETGKIICSTCPLPAEMKEKGEDNGEEIDNGENDKSKNRRPVQKDAVPELRPDDRPQPAQAPPVMLLRRAGKARDENAFGGPASAGGQSAFGEPASAGGQSACGEPASAGGQSACGEPASAGGQSACGGHGLVAGRMASWAGAEGGDGSAVGDILLSRPSARGLGATE